jgi:hypothetical protein
MSELIKGHNAPLGNEVVAEVLADALPRLGSDACGR